MLSLNTADIDHDGDIDLISASYNEGIISLARNNGNATFATFTSSEGVNSQPRAAIAADLDHDGGPELIMALGALNVLGVRTLSCN